VPIVSLRLGMTTDSMSHRYTCVAAEHAVDHGHDISAFQHGLLCIMPRWPKLALHTVQRVETYRSNLKLKSSPCLFTVGPTSLARFGC